MKLIEIGLFCLALIRGALTLREPRFYRIRETNERLTPFLLALLAEFLVLAGFFAAARFLTGLLGLLSVTIANLVVQVRLRQRYRWVSGGTKQITPQKFYENYLVHWRMSTLFGSIRLLDFFVYVLLAFMAGYK